MRNQTKPARDLTSTLFGGLFWLGAFLFTAVSSACLGYLFGQRALSGVSSPVASSNKGTASGRIRDPRTVPLVNEAEVISEAEARLRPAATPTPLVTPTPPPILTPTPTPTLTPSLSPELAAAPTPVPTPVLASPTPPPTSTPSPVISTPPPQPIAASGQVVMQVLSARREGGQVVLNVAMQNNSAETVRFLYSFLNVTDESGRTINALIQGLPGELPPNGQVFQGTIRIPASSLAGSQSLSVSLADYPSRRHQLRVAGIPVPQ